MRTFIATAAVAVIALVSVTSQSQARHRHHHYYTGHYGRYLAQHHRYYERRRYAWKHRHRHHDNTHPIAHRSSLTRAKLPDGQTIVVASPFADRFVGFFRDLFDREHKLPEIGCYAPTGHMRNSLHHWGGACDVGQRSRNVAWRPMYRVSDLARKWGLTDGANWGNPDAGHIEVNRRAAWHRPASPSVIEAARRPRTYQWVGAAPL